MAKAKLQRLINQANRRFEKGLNDDDQVYAMVQESLKTKGWTFVVCNSSQKYVICSDKNMLKYIVDKYGYWSEQTKEFNGTLVDKGGYNYMQKLQSPYQGTKNVKNN